MDDLKSDELVIRVDQSSPKRLRLDWRGRSNSRDPELAISPFLEQALVEADKHSGRIEMHFEAMEYFNSSTIVALIRVINAAKKAKVTLQLHYDDALKWQSLVFAPLKRAVASFDEEDRPEVEFLDTKVAR